MSEVFASLFAFLGIAVLVIVTPGQDTALTIRNTLLAGRSPGLFTAAGIAAGQALWTLATSVGLAALLVASAPAFIALKLAGAAYLIYIGLQALWSSVRGERVGRDGSPAVGELTPGAAFRQGALSNLGNPKMAVFFTSLLPQFAPVEGPAFPVLLCLGCLFCSITLTWLSLYALVVARAGDILRRSAVRRALDGVMGAVLVTFGIRLAVASR